MMTYWTKDFWLATLERVIRTAAGALLALLVVEGFDVRNADWSDIGATVGLAALISLLMAVGSNAATKSGPALTDSEQVVPPEPQMVDQPEEPEYVPERALNDE